MNSQLARFPQSGSPVLVLFTEFQRAPVAEQSGLAKTAAASTATGSFGHGLLFTRSQIGNKIADGSGACKPSDGVLLRQGCDTNRLVLRSHQRSLLQPCRMLYAAASSFAVAEERGSGNGS